MRDLDLLPRNSRSRVVWGSCRMSDLRPGDVDIGGRPTPCLEILALCQRVPQEALCCKSFPLSFESKRRPQVRKSSTDVLCQAEQWAAIYIVILSLARGLSYSA